MSRPRIKIPHVFVLLAGVILVCALFTWIVPSGQYERQTKTIEGHERTLLVPGTYEHVDKEITLKGVLLDVEAEGKATPVSLQGYMTAIPRGLEAAADIIFFIFLVGGVFGILQKTGVITAGIGKLLDKLGGKGPALVIVLVGSFVLFSLAPFLISAIQEAGLSLQYSLILVGAAVLLGTTNVNRGISLFCTAFIGTLMVLWLR